MIYSNFFLDNGGGIVAGLLDAVQHLDSVFVVSIIAHTANPSWRVEMHVNGLGGEERLDFVANALRLLTVFTLIAASEDLYAPAGHLQTATNHLFAGVNGGGVDDVAVVRRVASGCALYQSFSLLGSDDRLGAVLADGLPVNQIVNVLAMGDGNLSFTTLALLELLCEG